ncbi:hypothetical protein [Vibrio lentus]|uniref:hypothetical protein n=1 Tax=Vibrio lentus TaxID=136468 RepID=UPI000975A0AE|nr:hypothetical protein [Vibrio lentus]OMO22302.1 hypothetical protein BH583_08990 [Vibrio lentus]
MTTQTPISLDTLQVDPLFVGGIFELVLLAAPKENSRHIHAVLTERTLLTGDCHVFLIAPDKDPEPSVAALVLSQGDKWFIDSFAVMDTQDRAKGLGGKAFKELVSTLRSIEDKPIALAIKDGDNAMLRILRNNGFKHLRPKRHVQGAGMEFGDNKRVDLTLNFTYILHRGMSETTTAILGLAHNMLSRTRLMGDVTDEQFRDIGLATLTGM